MHLQRVEKASDKTIRSQKKMPIPTTSFQEVINKTRTQLAHDKLQQLMVEIEDQGQVLAESKTVDELRKYKKLVKEFMNEAIQNGLELQEQRGVNRRGRTKIYKTVQEVDRKLMNLTQTVLDKEKTRLDILNTVGEIKGLLINLYT